MLSDAVQNGLYTDVIALISESKPEEVVALIQTYPRQTQLELIIHIAKKLDHELGLNHVLDFGKAFSLTQSFNLDIDQAIALTRIIEFGHAVTQALSLELDIDLNFELIRHIDYTITTVFVIRRILDDLLDETTLHLTNIDALTAHALQEKILPYIHALGTLQKVVAEIRGEEFKEPIIQRIEADGALIDVAGMRAIAEILQNIIVPWQQQQSVIQTVSHVKSAKRVTLNGNFTWQEVNHKQSEIDLIYQVIEQIKPEKPLSEQQRTYYFAVLMEPMSILAQQTVHVHMKNHH